MLPSAPLRRSLVSSASTAARAQPIAVPKPTNATAALARRLASTVPLAESDVGAGRPTVTTLSNRLRVVTEPSPGHFQAVGVYVDAGSRYETARNSGVSHLIDRLAFKSTDKHTDAEMTTLIDSLGSQISCASSRETIMYQSSVFPSGLPTALSLLSSTILHPNLLPEEIEQQKLAAAYEIREIWGKPELILPEVLHTVAFKGNTLGMPLLCPEEQLSRLGEAEVRGFMRDWYRPERMVLAGVGMPHAELCELAERYFGEGQLKAGTGAQADAAVAGATAGVSGSAWARKDAHAHAHGQGHGLPPPGAKSYATVSNAIVDGERERLASAQAVYTGGEQYIDKPDDEFVNLYIGFEGLGIHDPDIYALATLQTLLGGGGSFSAGGPGKGMYTRLYTNALNRYHTVDFCAGFHHCYADSGIFGINAAVEPAFAPRVAELIAQQLHALTGRMPGGIEAIEFERAKNMLKSTLVMSLESKLVAVEDLGRQTQAHGNKVPVEEMCAKIDALTLQDLWRTANRVLRPSFNTAPVNYGLGSGKPTIVAQGPDLELLGDVKRALRRWDLGRDGA